MVEQTYSLYQTAPAIKLLQRALNEKLALNLTADGNMGKITQNALADYQESVGLVEANFNGICYGPKTQALLHSFIETKYLTQGDFKRAASVLGVDVASVKAVTYTEAKESGFLPSGFPVILFERHKFYNFLNKNKGTGFAALISAKNSDICNPKSGGYLGKQAEVGRLNRALEIDVISAYMSASWGLFQLMGFNHEACGYPTVVAFVEAMKQSEGKQLDAFVSFLLKTPRALAALKAKDWVGFTAAYNGSNWQAVNPLYPSKMASNFLLALKEG